MTEFAVCASRCTGKERDTESGLDYFGARFYGSSMGRFISPDPSGLLAQRPEDPQSWNLYAYARNNPVTNIDPTGLDCVYTSHHGTIDSIDHDSDAGECDDNGGTWAPGYVDENWATFNKRTGMFQVGSVNGAGSEGFVDYTMFKPGAKTDDGGNCLSGCSGYSFAGADTNWLQSQLAGNSSESGLDGYITFLTSRIDPIHGMFGSSEPGFFAKLLSGPLAFWKDHWAGPAGMGVPSGQGDWAASVHDYNFSTNGITLGTYFNPTVSSATAKALIQSNNNLIRNAGGFQGAKMGLFFGVVNAFQGLTHAF